jgi:hypothetical protein
MALLLDALAPGWKASLEGRDEPLDALLARAVSASTVAPVPPAPPATFPASEREREGTRAAADVAAWTASRARLRRDFLARPGWTVVVESAAPLFPQAFDPWNVERLDRTGSGTGPAREILHTRWLRLGNAAGTLETLDRGCLTESAGAHPLFSGARRATVAGIEEEPSVDTSEGRVRITARGLTVDFVGASATRGERTWTVSVPPAPNPS